MSNKQINNAHPKWSYSTNIYEVNLTAIHAWKALLKHSSKLTPVERYGCKDIMVHADNTDK